MDELADMLVLGGRLVNVGELDQDVLKEVLDAHIHVAGTGLPAPAEGIAAVHDVIVIAEEGDEEQPGEPLVEIREDDLAEVVNDQTWEELLAGYCENVSAGNPIEGLEIAGEQNREGDGGGEGEVDGDWGLEEYGEGATGMVITDDDWEQLIARYCRGVERGTEDQGGVGREEGEGVGRQEGSADRE